MASEQFGMPPEAGGIASGKVEAFGRHLAGLVQSDGTVAVGALDLMEVHVLAPNVMLMDVIEDGASHRIRFMGTAVVAIYGIEATNHLVDTVAMGNHTANVRDAHQLSTTEGRPVWSRSIQQIMTGPDSLYTEGRRASVERLVWPLHDEEKRIVRLAEIIDRQVIPGKEESFHHALLTPQRFTD